MSYPLNYPTPQNANVQIFQNPDTGAFVGEWVKPQGASFVWFTLIGAGGAGNATNGGGSGAVTNFMCPAFLIPDVLHVSVGIGGQSFDEGGRQSIIVYRQKDGLSGYTLLTAGGGNGGSSPSGGLAMTANYFTAMGFFQSVSGQAGAPNAVSASTTTFLSGGGNNGNTQASNYGYSAGPASTNRTGFFQMQPIIVGVSGMGSGSGGIGCGGGVSQGKGGNGLVVIITW